RIKIARAGVEDVDPRLRDRPQYLFQLLGRAGEPGFEILLLPLREAEEDGFVPTDRGADRAHQRDHEPGAPDVVAAPAIGSAVGFAPEKRVRQIAMGPMDRDAVEAGGD